MTKFFRAVILAGLLALAGALVAPGAAEAGVRCTRDYAPVCARGDRGPRTFDNANCARAAHARILRAGRCKKDIEPTLPNPYGPERCNLEERPVCAEYGAGRLTFPNACMAITAGATIVSWGACWY